MKKITLLTIALLFTISLVSQSKKDDEVKKSSLKHELNIDISGVVSGQFDVVYEHMLSQNTSYGINFNYNFDNQQGGSIDPSRLFDISGFYRSYSSKKLTRGFFLEGFTGLYVYRNGLILKDENGDTISSGGFLGGPQRSNTIDTETYFGLGISVGHKLVINSRFVAEFCIGLGRIIGNKETIKDNSFIGKFGIYLGYRF